MEQKKPTLAFTLLGRLKYPPVEGQSAPPDSPAFGPEFDGQFVFRVPTVRDQTRIGALYVAYWQREGVLDSTTVDVTRGLMVWSLLFFQVLGVSTPEWFSDEAEDDQDLVQAIIRAYQVARELLVERKKKSAVS